MASRFAESVSDYSTSAGPSKPKINELTSQS